MKDKMTKSSVDRKRSKYGEKYTLRFHKKTKTYELSCADEVPMLIAKFVETDGDLAMRLWERLENNYLENEKLKQREEKLLHEIEDFQDILASKEQIFLKRINCLIDEKIIQYSQYGESNEGLLLKQLKKELKE